MNGRRLAKDILAAAATLERGSESVRAVMASEENRFTRALADLQRLSEKEGIPMAIVDGLGAIRYGYPASTQDINVAIAREKLGALRPGCPPLWLQDSLGSEVRLAYPDSRRCGDQRGSRGGQGKKHGPNNHSGTVSVGCYPGIGLCFLARVDGVETELWTSKGPCPSGRGRETEHSRGYPGGQRPCRSGSPGLSCSVRSTVPASSRGNGARGRARSLRVRSSWVISYLCFLLP